MIDWILKPALLLAAAGLVQVLAKRAALRHFAWVLAFLGLLLLRIAPEIAVFRATSPVQVPAAVMAVDNSFGPVYAPPERNISNARVRIGTVMVLLWYMGILAAGARLAQALFDARRLTLQALPVGRHGRALVYESAEVHTPFTWGFVRPAIVLPATSSQWSEEARNHVLAHEYSHIQRADWLTQIFAQIVCCIHWFHPLVWLAAANMRRESERACDDAVVRAGNAPDAYAEHLFELARAARALPDAPAATVPMWDRSQLEDRIMKILDNHDRGRLNRAAAAGMALAALLVALPIASVRIYAQTTRSMSGVVNDPSGARVPNAKISLISMPANAVDPRVTGATAFSGPDGSYKLEIPQDGRRWSVMVEAAGFAALLGPVLPDQSVTRDFRLEVGRMSENVSVEGVRPANAPPRATAPERVRVGGNVHAANLLHKTNPEYPKELQAQGIEGTVELEAVISKEGNVLSLHPRSKTTHEGLIEAATQAVQTWQYRPTLLNGAPIEVITTVTVRFYLK